jgi:hypothetical protein
VILLSVCRLDFIHLIIDCKLCRLPYSCQVFRRVPNPFFEYRVIQIISRSASHTKLRVRASTALTAFNYREEEVRIGDKGGVRISPPKNLNDCPAIFAAVATPINSVFCVSIPALRPGASSEAEEVQGKALIDAALKHGVGHFVFASVDRHGADSDTVESDVPHFIRKANIEKHLLEKSVGTMTWTILRPTAFMDNLTTGFAGKIFPTAWKVGLSPATKLQLISSADIGYFGAQALLRPKEFAGRAISLAGDELKFGEANAVFKKKVGKDIPTTFGFVGSALIWAVKDVGMMFKFFEEVGYGANIQELRKEHPGLLSLSDWLETSIWAAEK